MLERKIAELDKILDELEKRVKTSEIQHEEGEKELETNHFDHYLRSKRFKEKNKTDEGVG